MKPNLLDEIFNTALIEMLIKEGCNEKDLESSLTNISSRIPEIVTEISEKLYVDLAKRQQVYLKSSRKCNRDFLRRHRNRWRYGLDLFESFLAVNSELGDGFNREYRPKAAESQDYLFEALSKLHARIIHVGFEILTLLGAGYADGAHARWRTAHEVAVTMLFLLDKGTDCAQKYLEHDTVQCKKGLMQFQKYAERLGHEKASDSIVNEYSAAVIDLCKKYGENFKEDYGWAAEALDKKRPAFSDIELAVNLDHLRPYYKMASHNVHSNVRGMDFNLGVPKDKDGCILLVGPSNYGLCDPAHGAALSITQASSALLISKPNFQSITMLNLLRLYADKIGDTFLEIQKRMEDPSANNSDFRDT